MDDDFLLPLYRLARERLHRILSDPYFVGAQMNHRLASLIVALVSIFATTNLFAQVDIYNSTTGTEVSGSISASYTTPFETADYPIYVTPNVSGNLATGTFFDAISFSGTAMPACGGCIGDGNVPLPSIVIGDTLTVNGSSLTQSIPFTVSMTVKPDFGSGAVSDIVQYFSVGGNTAGGGSTSGCFANTVSACGEEQTDPSNAAYTFSMSGTVESGGQLTFSSYTTGDSVILVGPTTTSINSYMNLDPTIQVFLPAGVTVTSASGVFPVSFVSAVPETPTYASILLGLGILAAFNLSRRKRDSASDRNRHWQTA